MSPCGGDYLAMPLGSFLDAVAAAEPTPGGGAVSAVAVAMAAGLAVMTAGFSPELPEAQRLAAQAEEARARVAPLAAADAAAYSDVLSVLARPRAEPGRQDAVRRALSRAADIPLEVAEAGAGIVRVAEHLERAGNPNLRGDARTARLLAAAAVRSAAALVELNLADAPDARVSRARSLADAANRSALTAESPCVVDLGSMG